jgi:hypothetical protein
MNILRIPRKLLPRNLRVICELYELLRKFDEYCDDAPLDTTSIDTVKKAISEKSRIIIESHIAMEDLSMNIVLQDAVRSSMNVLMWDHERRMKFHDTQTLLIPAESDIRSYIDDLE